MTVHWHDLSHPPALPGLYVKAALRRKVHGSDLPVDGLRCAVQVEPRRLAAYRQVCGFAESAWLPPTYPHVLAFPLQMQLLTAQDFPFPLLGLIHLHNRIRVLRPLGGVASAWVSVHVHNLQPHAKGAMFDLVTRLEDNLGLLWEAESRLLCKGVKLPGEPTAPEAPEPLALTALEHWNAPADIGRRYARVSGDYNPIHLSALSAKLFGLPQAIAHGLWSKARTLAALGERLPASGYEISVSFKKPLRLPGAVTLLASEPGPQGGLCLVGGEIEHMTGHWRALTP